MDHEPFQKTRSRQRRVAGTFGLAVLMCLSACSRPAALTEADAEREVNYQRAKKLADDSDFSGAAEFYKKALVANPEFAKAHLELGLLCDDKLGDPVLAIYHYRRYLELKPDSGKRQLVEDFIERAKLSLASKLPQPQVADPGELTRLQNERSGLLQENAMLRSRLAELEKGAGGATDGAPGGRALPTASTASAPVQATIAIGKPVEPAPAVETASARTHVVAKGDTLYSLALRACRRNLQSSSSMK